MHARLHHTSLVAGKVTVERLERFAIQIKGDPQLLLASLGPGPGERNQDVIIRADREDMRSIQKRAHLRVLLRTQAGQRGFR